MMYCAVWPSRDPDDETAGSWRAAIAMIPHAVKRRFGWYGPGEDDLEGLAALEAERARLDDYTNWNADG